VRRRRFSTPDQCAYFVPVVIDVGCSKLVISGQVAVKHGVEVVELKEESVVFTDGSEVPADVVIFACVLGINSFRNAEIFPAALDTGQYTKISLRFLARKQLNALVTFGGWTRKEN
jgi:hypothetical protein